LPKFELGFGWPAGSWDVAALFDAFELLCFYFISDIVGYRTFNFRPRTFGLRVSAKPGLWEAAQERDKVERGES
jgi:hypothetical protein